MVHGSLCGKWNYTQSCEMTNLYKPYISNKEHVKATSDLLVMANLMFSKGKVL